MNSILGVRGPRTVVINGVISPSKIQFKLNDKGTKVVDFADDELMKSRLSTLTGSKSPEN